MTSPPLHRSRVLGTPWPQVHATQIDSARHFDRHWHATYGVGLVEHGAQNSASGRGRVDARAGDIITTNPGEVHDGRPLDSGSRRWRMVYLETDLVASLAGPQGAEVMLSRPVIRDARLGAAWRQLFARLEAWQARPSANGVDKLACDESLTHGMALLLARHGTRAAQGHPHGTGDGPPPDTLLLRMRDRLADEWLAPPSLSDLAAMAGLSRYQALRHFEKAFGMPPHAWLRLRRAERARVLIRQGVGLAQAATDSGFADQSHMTRVFARHFGFTPGAWQQATRGRPLG